MYVTGVAELKSSLSKVLERVKAGEEVVVTERGRPIARILKLRDMDKETEDLVRRGVARPPLGELGDDFWDLPRPADPEGKALAALIEDRRTGR